MNAMAMTGYEALSRGGRRPVIDGRSALLRRREGSDSGATLSRPSGVQAPCHGLYAQSHGGHHPFPLRSRRPVSAPAPVNCQWTRG